ncbi:hypothetical protein HDU93_005005 [Gonapodya sp. JEL0774]|nr:hypothetical protein HDU93_005005 [Gonapodya sp. JEL0774]
MGLKKIRIEYWEGIKIMVFRAEKLPSTYEEFAYMICTKIPAVRAAAEQFVLRLKWREPESVQNVHLDDDDDLAVLFESGDTAVVLVELEEVTEDSADQLWSKERLASFRESLNTSLNTSQQQFNEKELPPKPVNPPSLPRIPQIEIAAPPGFSPDGTVVSFRSHEGSPLAQPTAPKVSFSESSLKAYSAYSEGSNGSIDRQQLTVKDRLANLISDPSMEESRSTWSGDHEVVSMVIARREFKFYLDWKSSASSSNAELMGVLGKPLWIGQRSWGYKKLETNREDMSITYHARKSSLRERFQRDTEYVFTILFDDASVFRSATEKYADKIDTLTHEDFRPFFVTPISVIHDNGNDRVPINTDWVCIQPPVELVVENPKAGGQYHCIYVVKDSRTASLSSSCRSRLHRWLKAQILAGSWGIKILVLRSENFPTKYDEFVFIICSKIPAVRAAAERHLIRLRFQDPEEPIRLIDIDDDDDLHLLFETSETSVVVVEFEEATNETRNLLWSRTRYESFRDFADANQSERGRDRAQRSVAPAAELVFPLDLAKTQVLQRSSGLPPVLTIPTGGQLSDANRSFRARTPERNQSPLHSSGRNQSPMRIRDRNNSPLRTPDLNTSQPLNHSPLRTQEVTHSRSLSMLSDSTLADRQLATFERQSTANVTKDQRITGRTGTDTSSIEKHSPKSSSIDRRSPPGSISESQALIVMFHGREFTFPLEWRTSGLCPKTELMGVIGKSQWTGQQAWGYKQLNCNSDNMSITYGVRFSTLREKLKNETEYIFTMMFDSRPIFRAAAEKYPPKLDGLTAHDFTMAFVNTLSEVREIVNSEDTVEITTDWACIPPPVEAFVENPHAGGKYHCLYIIKDSRNRLLSDSARTRLQMWLKMEMGSGLWCEFFIPQMTLLP